ncbi:MAG TPA: formate dehydrogenase accessory protein FdhE, partial [Terriglobales bacterium]|nr:formate dehydrogenase accessory protein FdhE [Terriglobales bacterium]
MPNPDWNKRAARARELISETPAAAELLRFYAPVLDFQGRLYSAVSHTAADAQRSLRAQLDPGLLVPLFPELLAVVEAHGTAQLREAAGGLRRLGEPSWRELLLDYLGGQQEDKGPAQFFVRACVEPYAEHLASQFGARPPHTTSSCPACAG